jgi:hypothetical protein
MAFHRWLIKKALNEDNPSIPMVAPNASVAATAYVNADAAERIPQFNRRIPRLAERLVTLPADAVGRTVVLGDARITVAAVAHSAWHECHHHLADLARSH